MRPAAEQRGRRDHLERRAGWVPRRRARGRSRCRASTRSPGSDRSARRSRRARRAGSPPASAVSAACWMRRVDRHVDGLRGAARETASPCARFVVDVPVPDWITTVPRRAPGEAGLEHRLEATEPDEVADAYGGPSWCRRSFVISPTVPTSCSPRSPVRRDHRIALVEEHAGNRCELRDAARCGSGRRPGRSRSRRSTSAARRARAARRRSMRDRCRRATSCSFLIVGQALGDAIGLEPDLHDRLRTGEERTVGRDDRRSRRPAIVERRGADRLRARDRDRRAANGCARRVCLGCFTRTKSSVPVQLERPEAGESHVGAIRRGRAGLGADQARRRVANACSPAPTSRARVAVVARSGGGVSMNAAMPPHVSPEVQAARNRRPRSSGATVARSGRGAARRDRPPPAPRRPGPRRASGAARRGAAAWWRM